jgi:hypothetical protein
MKKLTQTRLHNPSLTRGNCYSTVIACFMDLESSEDVIQIQDIYDTVEDWQSELLMWVNNNGWDLGNLHNHLNDDSYYLVTGISPRNPNINHVCIYKNGKLWHDPHPDGTGIQTEDYFQYLEKVSKVCFKCGEMKSLSEYYKHSGTKDGLLGKCKTCTKADSKKQNDINTSNPEGLEKERERHRSKYHRLGYKESQKEWNKDKPWKNTNTYKGLRNKYYKNLPRNFELHHWNYNDEYLEDIFILDIRDHKNLHNYLSLDIEKRIFYITKSVKYLDTKKKHLEYIKELQLEIYKQ